MAPLSDYLDPSMFRGHMVRGSKIGFRVIQLCPAPLPGDLVGNGVVDYFDVLIMLSNYGMTEGASAAGGDLDCDGDVDLADLAALLANFGETLGG